MTFNIDVDCQTAIVGTPPGASSLPQGFFGVTGTGCYRSP
jgi:hypothetical protein